MSRFDDLRQKVGVEPTSTKGSKPTLKTPNFSTRSVTPASEVSYTPDAEIPTKANSNARPVRPTQISPGAPSFNIGNSPLIQQVNADRVEAYKRQLDTMQAEDNPAHFTTDRNAMLGVKARNVPLLGGALRTLDTIGRKVEPVADVLRSFYIPGAGVGEIGALTGAAEGAIARAFPKLASTAAGKLGQKVATEAIVGAPLGAAGTQMMNPDASIKDLAKGAALGAGLGAALPLAGSGISRLRNLAKNAAPDITKNYIRNANLIPDHETLALPQGRGEARYNAAMDRGNLTPNEETIFGHGNVKNPEPIGLPAPNLGEATRARITTKPNEYTRKLENLFATANKMKLTPGKELEEVESLWSQMAGPNDPDLNGLIERAYPNQPSKLTPESLNKARTLQQQREVAGVPLKAKSLSDRYKTYVGDAGLPREKVGYGTPKVEIIPPKRNFAPTSNVQQLRELAQQKKAEPTATPVQETAKPAPLQTNSNWNYGGESKEAYASKHVSGASTSQSHIINPAFNPVDTIQKDFAGNGVDLVKPKYGKDLMITQPKADGTLDIIGTVKFGPDNSIEHFVLSPELRGKGVGQKLLKYLDSQGIDVTNAKLMSEDYSKAVNKFKASQVSEAPTPIPNERSNFANQRENGNFSSEFNAGQAKRDLTYEPLANKEVSDRVDERFNKESIDSIEADFLSNHELNADHTMTGYKLMKKLDQAGLAATDPELRKTLITKAVNVAEKLAADLTRAGQATQAAAVLKRLSPEGQFLNFVREATKNKKAISPKDAEQFMEQAKIRQENISSGPETANFYDLLDRIKAGEKVSADEIRSSAETMLAEAKQNVKPEKPVKEVKPRVRDKVLSYLEKEAEAAKKELAIKNNLGFARKAGTPDIVLWSKVMAHELAKKTINIADFTELLVKQAGEQIRPHAKAIYEQSKRLIGRADKRIGPDKVKILEKFIEEGKFTPVDEKALRGIAADIDKLKGAKGLAADMKMQQILNKYQKTSPYGMLQTLRYMMMLMNESTQSLNAISGPIMMLTKQMWDIAATPIDMALSKVIPNWERTTTFKQGPGLFDNVFTPMVDWFKGLKTGGKAGWQGVDPEGITSQHDIRGRAFKDKVTSWNLGLGERTLGMVAKAPDYATFNATRNMELRKIAYLDAINSGVKGKEAQRAHMQKFLADPPQQAIEQAARQGKKTTFQFNEGAAGKVARWGAKPLSPAVPFIKTPMNIGITGMEHTPAGILKGLYEIALLARGSENISKREILQTLTTSTVGGTAVLGGLGYVLANLGIITGDSTTKEKDVQALKDFTGEGKFKFNTTAFNRMFDVLFDGDMNKIKEASKYQPGDKQLDYNRLQPLAMPVAMGATFQQDKGKPMGERLTDTAKSTGSSLFGMTALKGLQDIASAPIGAQGSDKTFAFFNNIAESYAKSFSPSPLAAEARRQDSSQRDVSFNKGFKEDVGSYYKSRIPESFRGLGLGTSKDLPEKITNLGDVKQNIDPYLNTLKSEKSQFNQAAKIISDVIKKTGDESLAPTAMETTVKGTKKGEKEQKTIKIDPKRYDKLQRDVGTEITQKIIALSPDRRTAKYIEKIYSDTRTKYRDKLKKELGLK